MNAQFVLHIGYLHTFGSNDRRCARYLNGVRQGPDFQRGIDHGCLSDLQRQRALPFPESLQFNGQFVVPRLNTAEIINTFR